jgi:DNA transformation protein
MRSEFVDFLLEQLTPMGGVRARAMFGGYGLYRDDLFFGIVIDDQLYLKVDTVNKPRFDQVQAQPFRYAMKSGKMSQLSFYQPPDSALDDPDELADWVQESVGAALRARAAKSAKKKK